MIKFISSKSKNPDVEEVMNRISNYIKSNDDLELLDLNIEETMAECFERLQTVNEIYEVDARKQIIVFGRFGKIKKFIKKFLRKCMAWYVQDIVDQQNQVNAAVVCTLNEMYEGNRKLKLALDKTNSSVNRINLMCEKTNSSVNRINLMCEKTNSSVNRINLMCEKTNSSVNRINLMCEKTNPFSDEWYVAFENIYRGSIEEIRKRNEKYLKWFNGMTSVIDLGCGRGEFLDLLKENGIIGKGVDLNNLMLLEARKKELPVFQEDCIKFMEQQKDATIDGIFAGQLVEHLNLNELVELFKVAYKKLMKNGIFVIETVNPMTLGVFCYGFYIDATHSVPVHPSSLQFIAGQVGFSIDAVEFTEEFPEEYKIKITDDMDAGIKAGFDKLNKQIYGAQDYYIVCRKR